MRIGEFRDRAGSGTHDDRQIKRAGLRRDSREGNQGDVDSLIIWSSWFAQPGGENRCASQ